MGKKERMVNSGWGLEGETGRGGVWGSEPGTVFVATCLIMWWSLCGD